MRKEMETKNEDEIKRMVKKVFPQMMALANDKVCPSEDALAAFAEGKLKGKKEEQVISHLAFCNNCLGMVKFLREAPSADEVSVPLWLEKTVCDLFPEKPKTWEIVVGVVKTGLVVLKHTAEECWTIPTLELVPAKMKLKPAYASFEYLLPLQDRAKGLIWNSKSLPKGEKSLKERFTKRELEDLLKRAIGPEELRSVWYSTLLAKSPKGFVEDALEGRIIRGSEPPWPAASAAKDKILKSLKKRISNGLVFVEHIGPYNVYLAIIKKEDKRTDVFEVEIEVHDRSGRFAEEIEVSFIQGRKTIEKSVTRKETKISKRLSPKKYSIKLKHKGLYLGQALLDLRKEKPKQIGQWD
jgi:hypothetical protein